MDKKFVSTTVSKSRNTLIDSLRGLAILGILIMNIQSFSMVESAYLNPISTGSLEGLDLWVFCFGNIFADQKFMTIFSLLFGVSTVIIYQSYQNKGLSAIRTLVRRNTYLLLIGLLHAYLIWHGDILTSYAICGLFTLLFIHKGVQTLFLTGFILISIPFINLWLYTNLIPHFTAQDWEILNTLWQPSEAQIAAEIEVMRSSWLQQQSIRLQNAVNLQTMVFLEHTFWRVSGLMLIGMALYKLDFFSAHFLKRKITHLFWGCLIIGLGLSTYGLYKNFYYEWQAVYSLFLGSMYSYVGSLLLAMAYVCGASIIVYGGYLKKLTDVLCLIGRTALSNYLLQSLLCTWIFYGHGLAWFASLSRFEQWLLLPCIYLLQIVLTHVWLKYFRQGPVEWLWRSLVLLSSNKSFKGGA